MEIEKAAEILGKHIKSYEQSIRAIETVNEINKDWDGVSALGQPIQEDDKRYVWNREGLHACGIAIQALKKQIERKPYGDKSDERTLWKCPDCKYIFVTEFPDMSLCGGRQSKHCPECGQKIDWSDEQ